MFKIFKILLGPSLIHEPSNHFFSENMAKIYYILKTYNNFLSCLTVSNVFIAATLYTERQLSKVSGETLRRIKRQSTVDVNWTAEFRALFSGGIIFLKLFCKTD